MFTLHTRTKSKRWLFFMQLQPLFHRLPCFYALPFCFYYLVVTFLESKQCIFKFQIRKIWILRSTSLPRTQETMIYHQIYNIDYKSLLKILVFTTDKCNFYTTCGIVKKTKTKLTKLLFLHVESNVMHLTLVNRMETRYILELFLQNLYSFWNLFFYRFFFFMCSFYSIQIVC